MTETNDQSQFPNHVESLIANTREVGNLIRLHAIIVGGKRGRPPDLEVLSKSSVVLLVACWEAYIEDLASNAFDFLLSNADTPRNFPNRVLTLASKSLRDNEDERRVWEIAGEGWRSVLVKHQKELFDRYIGRLNTPRPSNIDILFESIIGMPRLSRAWKWKGLSNQSALDKLDRLITLRGEIAHRVKASRSVQRRYVEKSTNFINRLAATSSNAVRVFLNTRVNSYPWIYMRYGETG